MHRNFAPQLRLDRRFLTGVSAAALLAPLVAAGSAQAVQFNRGELTGSFDTTITVGATFRVQDRDPDLIGRANGGRGNSINGDNGNLNYDKGLVALSGRVTHELSLNYQNIGAFTRATYFYDVVNAQKSSSDFGRTNRFPLSGEAVERVGRDFRLLDAVIFGDFAVGEQSNVSVRLGNQVLSWGESTFIANGINAINPVDVSALRVPGSELKEAFLPVPIADITFSVTPDLSLEAFYQFKWDQTEPEANGTFFSTSDAASPGSRGLFIGFGNPLIADNPNTGAIPAHVFNPPVVNPITGSVGATSLTPLGSFVPRLKDQEPDDQGQYGLALRYFAEGLGDTELGAYYINYHSRLPLFSSVVGPLTALATSASTFTRSSGYQLEYPEDIQLFGASFNTLLFGGVSVQGEYSLKKDQPLQLDDVDLLQATLAAPAVFTARGTGAAAGSASFDAAVNAAIAATPALAPFAGRTFEQIQAASPQAAAAISAGIRAAPGSPGGTRAEFQAFGGNRQVAATSAIFNSNPIIRRLGGISEANAASFFGRRIQGWVKHDVSQAQVTASKALPPMLGANQVIILGEVGATYVHDFPESSALRYDGPGTTSGGNAAFLGVGGMPTVLDDGFATKFSWGYRAVARLDYLGAIGGVNLFPSVSWQHDVNGTTPGPVSNFLEGRKALSVGVRAIFLESWTADLNYSTFWGAGNFNQIRDRDFISASLKYAF
ncbi:MAG TPA: DUF1302 domain-containing protein [Azospirillaceae bacterium]|nr:DUF1302 domain-containing protein [Azospirillaceae bacterium]